MCSTPQYLDYSIPPSPLFPPVPCVSRASSESSLNSLYDLDGRRLEHSLQYAQYNYTTDSPRSPDEEMSNPPRQQFTEEELEKAFQDLKEPSTPSSRSSPGQRLIHDVNDPQSPWKRSIRLRYSEVNMRESNTLALQEASDLLSRDMSSYVCPFCRSGANGRLIRMTREWKGDHLLEIFRLGLHRRH